MPVRFSILLISTMLCVLARASAAPPNILLIVVDDMRPFVTSNNRLRNSSLMSLKSSPPASRALGELLTPNLNQFSERSTTFANAYASCPRCNASRAAMLTGIASDWSGFYTEVAYSFRNSPFKPLANAVTLPQLLRSNGYFTVGLGKVFHGVRPQTGPDGQVQIDWPDTELSWTRWVIPDDVEPGIDSLSPLAPRSGQLSWGTVLTPLEESTDFVNANGAGDLLRGLNVSFSASSGGGDIALPRDQPFFFAVGLRRPHSPWYVTQEALDRIPVRVLGNGKRSRLIRAIRAVKELPQGALRVLNMTGKRRNSLGKLGIAIGAKADRRKQSDRPRILASRLKVWEDLVRHYLADVSIVDSFIGEILDGLRDGPFADGTVVAIVSDHGIHMGEQLHVGKTTLWEPSLRSLFLISKPGGGPRQVIREPVSLVDVYPTLAAAAGIKVPENRRRQNLWSIVQGRKTADPSRVVVASTRDGMVARSGEWKYIRYRGRGGEEYYDLRTDPFEGRNLISPGDGRLRLPRKAAEVLETLRAEVDR